MVLPNTNISVAIVKAELGASTNDVGWLCIHPNINMWSRWKPISLNKVEGIVAADLISANFGLTIQSYETVASLLTAIDAGAGFTYIRPSGGASSPYRIGDFRTYDHDAYPSVRVSTAPTTITKGSAFYDNVDYYTIFGAGFNDATSTIIGYNEVYPVTVNKLGLILKNGATNYFITATTDTINSINLNWNTTPIKNWTGTINAYLFMTNLTQTTGTTTMPSSGVFVPIAMGNTSAPRVLTVNNNYAPNSVDYFATSRVLHNGGSSMAGTYEIKFSSIGAAYTGATVTNPRLAIYNNASKTVLIDDEIWTNFTLSAEQEVIKTGVFAMPNDGFGNPAEGYFEVTAGGKVRKSGDIALL